MCRTGWVLLLLLLTPLSGWAQHLEGEEPATFRIGLIPEMNVFEQVERFRGLADYIASKLDQPVELTMLSRYGNIIDRMHNQDVDAAFLGSFTGALAVAQLEMTPIARPINLDGTSTYWGCLFVRRDSGISDVAGMRGLRLALVERATTAGYVFPISYLRSRGVDDPDTYFSEIQFWGSHDAAIRAVLEGQADVGAAKNTIWEFLASEDPRVENELEILARSPEVPSNGLLVSAQVDPATREKLRGLLLGLGTSSGDAAILEQLRVRGFVSTDKADYAVVFDLARGADIDPASYEYDNR